MKITVTEFITLDGVTQGPGSADEDTSDGFTAGGWLVPHMDETFIRQASEWLDLAGGLLLGRRTYEAFARDWPQITDPDDPFTGRMNGLPKYVVSSTLTELPWQPATLLCGEPVEEVSALRSQPGRELQIHGSNTLAASLLEAGLVDTLRLVVAPTALGTGRQLFGRNTTDLGFRLRHHTATPAGLLILEYEPNGRAAVADYEGVAAAVTGSHEN
ncbi:MULTISPECIES: dihydrofolate reductase family protein [Gordonia]|jgi:dihydrofolate reductase|uniref:Bacterial bifunctional deaminase-reductase C-terminal domain-containing protein n=2 Tax=Gordonia alkanivorans TaxID=84096 RepID=F9VQZ7_9ACTN|nr:MULTISPECIES: dihydrofolate reductase family protein [Gordonia]ETA06383.1 deaminase reductase [Gordonia alkanivorans CGMCC 6845]MDH3006579.1 dihydrofolate reductase family protein [Gordonia alkanivorans]MDH3014336.1 dihydrofolate reductase family protein [Gordonia alkanivorans]MDH3018559.1 dihydrofolate reductase family protein [Gordonia alkanivorans]MDH3023439.1 dihydrofolate reductase family protein [Gordonia alkanivorans]